MTKSFRTAFTLAVLAVVTSIGAAETEVYSKANPPPASFVFAGPLGGMVDASGNGTVLFRFVAMIHSIKPSRIQVIDADSGETLVDDPRPSLKETPYKHPSKPTVSFYQWEGRSSTQTISDSEPAWLHDGQNTVANLEIRLFAGARVVFSFKQPASYSAGAKAQILHAVEYNKSLKPAN